MGNRCGGTGRSSCVAVFAGLVIAGLAIPMAAAPASAETDVLFVGNSFTHGRYPPVLNYNAADASDPSNAVVHDLLCPGTGTGSCASGVEATSPVFPTSGNTPGGTLAAQLNYLNSNPTAQYTEVGPFGGTAGIFLQLTKDAGLDYNVSLMAVSSATLKGYLNNTGNEAGDLPLIENSKYQNVVLQDQSFQPLPTTINVNGQPVPTRGNPTNFKSGVNGLISGIDGADATAGTAKAAITLYESPPLAEYGYTSSNPNQPIFGSSTPAAQGGNPAYAPYLGDANPMAAMASDLHNAYTSAAASAAKTYGNTVDVALAGDAWITAMNSGLAQTDPYLVNEPAGEIDLWDSDPLLACCTTPVGYHPSVFGDYLDAMSLFYTITGINPLTLQNEFDPVDPNYALSASDQLGITPAIAYELAEASVLTQDAGGPVPEPASILVFGFAAVALGGIRARRGGILRRRRVVSPRP